jgi:hypothetical protein
VLALAVSDDDGATWHIVTRLEDSGGRVLEYSYPAIIQVVRCRLTLSNPR